MKEWLLKVLASAALKAAIAYSYSITVLVVDALNGVISGGNLADSYKESLTTAVRAVESVRDFLGKLKEMLGIEDVVLKAGAPLSANLDDIVGKLNKITDSI